MHYLSKFTSIAAFCYILATQQGHVSPLTPAELLVALHNIDTSKVDMKTIIKGKE